MPEILLKLFLFLSSNSLPIANDLLPPLLSEIITEKLSSCIHSSPEDLVTLYSWKNGVDFEGNPSRFFDYCYLYNLQEAIDDYYRFQKLTYDQALGIDYKFLFPICLTGAGEYYFYCFGGEGKGKIFYESVGRFGREIMLAFNSLEQMISSIFKCYAQHIYFYHKNGKWQMKTLEQESVMKKLNPDCNRWEDFN